ncbi:uncharacterized protein BO80DRAFT_58459 [Aspergillus ibericus CBS 121593]|uniref:Uncharacterized protein n=1 Tax=Aspergillus ibericus CBS 121593 TaxID=1448316 RepID=A0A395H215_9EURO|nr:hypothetical protein BO80DRAFT_58459 [Aspergillus ibericus CBS 121593]RAL01439.1 hypothetical protein BO80DRAFT_58459 [Aspergillus ibericus CBS 121593]
MSGFIHKAEDALHLHHHHHHNKEHTEHKDHPEAKSPPLAETGHPQGPPPPGSEGKHHNHGQHRSNDDIAREDFLADREYDRVLKSPDHGPGVGFEA